MAFLLTQERTRSLAIAAIFAIDPFATKVGFRINNTHKHYRS